MRNPIEKQGLIRRTITTVLLLCLLAVPSLAHAVSFDELAKVQGTVEKTELAEMMGLSETSQCSTQPANPGTITEKNAKDLVVEAGGIKFTLDHMFYSDRSGADKSFDFVFTPEQDGKRLDQPAFVYRTGEKGKSNAFVFGVLKDGTPVTADGFKLDDNMVLGRCANFDDSPFAKALDEAATEDNQEAFNIAGRASTSAKTDAFSGDDSDPFTQAVQKMTEIVTSLNTSVVSALTSVMDLSNITDVKGLTDAWKVVRDLVNLLFFLILAVLAVLTIIRVDVKNYNVRQALPLLVFAVIAVNFGLLFARVLVDTAFVLSQPFMTKAQAIVQTTAISSPAGASSSVDFGTAVVLLLASVIMLLGLVVLLFFFIIRIIVVWLLAALSPVIFLFMVLPLTRGEAKKLITTWIQWVYMAPIAFLILYIGSAMLLPAFGNQQNGDSGASAILSAIFYAGVLAAAVLIPYGLGGSVMKMAGGRGMSAAGLAGKGGLGAAALIPAGRGRTIGQRVRTGKALLKGRQDSLEQDAAYDAANLRLYAANRGLGGLAGLSDGQQIALQEQMVGQREKEMMPFDSSAKMRIAHAWQYGTDQDAAGNVYALGADGQRFGGANAIAMTEKEQSLTSDRFAAAAAYKTLASGDISEPYMVEKPGLEGRTFAWTGYQQMHRGNPVIGAHDLAGRFNEGKMKIIAQTMNADDLKGVDTEMFTNATSPTAAPEAKRRSIEFFRNVDEVRLGNAVNADHRNKFSTAVKQDQMYQIAKSRQLSSGIADAQAAAAQRRKEDVIIHSYEYGRQKLDQTRPSSAREEGAGSNA